MAKKEMHFFGSDLRFGPQFYRRDREAYLAEFEGGKGRTWVGEASVWYLFSRQAAAEIKAFNPAARIIVMLREPAAMMYSLYNHFRADGNEYLPTFQKALEAEADRRAGRRIGRLAYLPQALVYHDVPRFTEQVKRYFDAFGREQVHVIIYDEFKADNAASYRKTLDFLGVDSSGAMPSFDPINVANVNGNESVRFPVIRDILNDPLVRGTAIQMRALLPRRVFAAMQKFEDWSKLFNRRQNKRPPPARDLQALLRREFAAEVEQLSALLGRDLSHWSQTESPQPVPASSPARVNDNKPHLIVV